MLNTPLLKNVLFCFNYSSKQASTIMKIIENRDTCRMLSGGAATGPDDNSHGEVKGSVIYLVVATLAEVDHFPSSTSIRWASEIGAKSVYC